MPTDDAQGFERIGSSSGFERAAPAPSTASALGQGFVHGLGDILYGGAQIGARMQEPTAFAPTDPTLAARVDEAVRQRESAYRNSPAVTAHPVASEVGNIGGALVGTAPLAAAGIVAAPAGAAGAIGTAAALGAASGALQPTEHFSAAEKLKQAGIGGATGAIGGAVGEIGGSLLGKAIAGNSPQAVESALTRQFRHVVKPSRVGKQTASEISKQDRNIVSAVDRIIANKPNLMLTDESGTVTRGELPKSLKQFSEAIEQTKGGIFAQYDQMAKAAGNAGARVDLMPAAINLVKEANKPEILDFHPSLAADAERLAATLAERGSYTTSQAQAAIQNINRTLNGFWKNPTHETVSRAALLAPVVSNLRQQLDSAIESAEGPGYQALRNQYAALKSIEKDVAAAVQREGNKIVGGIGGIFSDIAASEEAIRGVLTLNPAALARSGTIKAAQLAMRYINSPNRAIMKLFDQRANPATVSSPTRTAIGQAVTRATPLAAVGQSPLSSAMATAP